MSSEEREKRQAKVFKKFKKREVTSLVDDFDDGVNLCLLYDPVNKFVKEVGIGLTYGPAQIEKGDEKQILGLLWILITKFVIPESEDQLSRKKALLRWVQKVTEPYDGLGKNIKNFHRDWKTGMAFNALLDQFDDSLMDYGSLESSNAADNCQNAFDIAEGIGITRLLDVEDITDFDVPDEKSIMMYVSLYYQHFHKNLASKLKKEAEKYCVDVEKLLSWLDEKIEFYSIQEFDQGIEESHELMENYGNFLSGEKQQYGNYKCHLYVVLASIQRRQKKEQLQIFVPDDDHSLTKVQKKWLQLNKTLTSYNTNLDKYMDQFLYKYEEHAAETMEWIYSTQSQLTKIGEVVIEEDQEIPVEEESTDEETRAKRAAAAEECNAKADEVKTEFSKLGFMKSRASITAEEIDYAVATFEFSILGKDSEALNDIKDFVLE